MWNWLKKLINGGAEAVGDIEDVVHRPIYPVSPYWALVDPARLVRGSWPDRNMLIMLKSYYGCRNVVNLCSERSQDDLVSQCGLRSFDIAICDDTAPTSGQLAQFLSICRTGMTYVHCEAGKGRTGCMVAAYRVIINRWSPVTALEEAKGYGLALPCQEDFILGLNQQHLVQSAGGDSED